MVELFTSGLYEVCEGQALDLRYERSRRVTLRQYFAMIEKKTARLFSMSAELGGLAGGGTPRQVRALRNFGHYLGRAFQVQDDLLDIVAEQRQFGKRIGGDIVEGKKTFLLLSALERARKTDREALQRVMSGQLRTGKGTVSHIAGIYARTGAINAARAHIRRDTQKAAAALDTLPRNNATAMLRWFSGYLLARVF
jgi:geranylgeranyl diphosphate synthase type II